MRHGPYTTGCDCWPKQGVWLRVFKALCAPKRRRHFISSNNLRWTLQNKQVSAFCHGCGQGRFLAFMDGVIPLEKLETRVRLYYPKAGAA